MKKFFIISIIIIIAVGLIGWKTYPILNELREPKTTEFTQEKWNEEIEGRYVMINDLLDKYDFGGMRKEDVIDLLGRNGLTEGDHYMEYEMRGGLFKDINLYFVLDNNDKVAEYAMPN